MLVSGGDDARNGFLLIGRYRFPHNGRRAARVGSVNYNRRVYTTSACLRRAEYVTKPGWGEFQMSANPDGAFIYSLTLIANILAIKMCGYFGFYDFI